MENATMTTRSGEQPNSDTAMFYRHVLETLNAAQVSFLVGGAYAFNRYTGIDRHTKDLDLFLRRSDFHRAAEALEKAGYRTELTFSHWLGKAHHDGFYIDLIFSSGNAVAEVDDQWFEYAIEEEVLGVPVKISPPEEMIWSKAYIMERERYDGADVAHLLRACGDKFDWARLFRRFDPHWRVLLAHLVLFGFIYPTHRKLIPASIMDELLERLRREMHEETSSENICFGTLLSREQYLSDIEQESLQDGRLEPLGRMTPEQTACWTRAIGENRH